MKQIQELHAILQLAVVVKAMLPLRHERIMNSVCIVMRNKNKIVQPTMCEFLENDKVFL